MDVVGGIVGQSDMKWPEQSVKRSDFARTADMNGVTQGKDGRYEWCNTG
jgi:hypothetical protein